MRPISKFYWLPLVLCLTACAQGPNPVPGLATDGVRLFATFGNEEVYAFVP